MFNLGKKASQAKDEIYQAYGTGSVGLTTIKEWYAKFKKGEFNLEDQPRSGRPKEMEDEELLVLLEEDDGQSTRELAKRVNVNQSTVLRRLKALGKVQKATRWVPHALSSRNKDDRMNIAMAHLTRHRRKSFLWRIVTGDEKWVYYDNPERKRQWVNPGTPSTSTPKRNIHGKKVLLCMWWDMKGLLYYELLDPGQTVTAQRYCDQLSKLNEKISELRKYVGHSGRKVILLHDNARPHGASATKNMILALGWEVLPHPPYSPDLAPTDFHIFRSLQHYLAGQHFKTRDEVKKCIDDFIDSKDEDFFTKGIYLLPQRWQKTIDANGEYFED